MNSPTNYQTNNLIRYYGIAEIYPSCSRAFKQLQLQDVMEIPCQKPDIEQIISITVNVIIKSLRIICTPTGRSFEGQILTGRKLIIEGILRQKLEYVADVPEQPVHAAHFEIPFSSFIILGDDLHCQENFEVTGYIEDIYIKMLDKRKVFKNVVLLLNAIPVTNI